MSKAIVIRGVWSRLAGKQRGWRRRRTSIVTVTDAIKMLAGICERVGISLYTIVTTNIVVSHLALI